MAPQNEDDHSSSHNISDRLFYLLHPDARMGGADINNATTADEDEPLIDLTTEPSRSTPYHIKGQGRAAVADNVARSRVIPRPAYVSEEDDSEYPTPEPQNSLPAEPSMQSAGTRPPRPDVSGVNFPWASTSSATITPIIAQSGTQVSSPLPVHTSRGTPENHRPAASGNSALPLSTNPGSVPVNQSAATMEGSLGGGGAPADQTSTNPVHVRARRSGIGGVDLHVHWDARENEAMTSVGATADSIDAAEPTTATDIPGNGQPPAQTPAQPQPAVAPAPEPCPAPGWHPRTVVAPTPVIAQPQAYVYAQPAMAFSQSTLAMGQQGVPIMMGNEPYLHVNPPIVAPSIAPPAPGTGAYWCYPNEPSPFWNNTSCYRSDPPVYLQQRGAPAMLMDGQSYIIRYP